MCVARGSMGMPTGLQGALPDRYGMTAPMTPMGGPGHQRQGGGGPEWQQQGTLDWQQQQHMHYPMQAPSDPAMQPP
jgi:hypothetical protein